MIGDTIAGFDLLLLTEMALEPSTPFALRLSGPLAFFRIPFLTLGELLQRWYGELGRVMNLCRGMLILHLAVTAAGLAADTPKAPFRYVWGRAYHILPETHNDEAGYFSLCEGLNGKIYVGTSKNGVGSFLVEFDPVTERQRIVIDTHKLCGLTDTGFAAQAKIHTRNYVGPSGVVYLGSMRGHRTPGDTEEYPGGYLMTYDPKADRAQCLGMPYPEESVIDVRADEERGLIYVVTYGAHRWVLYDAKQKTYRELGPKLLPFGVTHIDALGRAHTLTKDFQLATYDPQKGKVTLRPIDVGQRRWKPECEIPVWVMAQDGRTSYLVMMDDPTLLSIDLLDNGPRVRAANRGPMIEGQKADCRSALAMGPDGKVYAIFGIANETGFGAGKLHYLLRYDPKAKKHEKLGVLAVENPDFFSWKTATGQKPPWSHGYHTLPDGTLTPLWHHMALTVARDSTIYATILYPFTLLKIDSGR